PVHWSVGLNGWAVTRYVDVLEIFSQPQRFSSDRFRKVDEKYASRRSAVREVGAILDDWLVFRDPPDHTRLRSLLQKSFTPTYLARSRDRIQATIGGLLDLVAERGEMDFIRDVAFPLPATVIAILLGAPVADIELIKDASDRLAAYLGGSVAGKDNFGEARDGVLRLADYFRALLHERHQHPQDDLMSLMLSAEQDGERLSHDEVVANCVLLLFAGHETTTNLLGNGLFHLLHNPQQTHLLRDNPDLTSNAVEEFLRYDGPVPATIKIATEDTVWHGKSIKRGDMVLPFISAANRDPQQFARPDDLDIRRSPNRNLAFAYGIHFCLGAPLARLEGQITFETLLRRFPKLALKSARGDWKPMIFLRGLERLPLTWQ
ncbi:MAG TPA: cytochrome P450, partial [Candidatus Acidoferrales bacterium]|nr:cytochrome P450 [Candidatus Acidoferrales bacterium]